jgi:hypothetical protein
MMPSDIPPNSEENLEKLPEDNDTPAAPAQFNTNPDNTTLPLGSSHPSQDSKLDDTEALDAGLDAASGATPPQPSDVLDYEPHQDE